MEKTGIVDKLTKPAKWIGLGCFAVVILAVLLFMFCPAIHVDDGQNQNAGPEYTGWMISFYYFGRQLIYNKNFFGFNAALALGSVFAVLTAIVSLLMLRKSKKLRLAILMFIVAVFALWAGIAYVNALGLAESTATNDMWIRFNSIEGGTYLHGVPVLSFVLCLISSLVLIAEGVLLVITSVQSKKREQEIVS